jgi:uncharacterized GH25 family protein
MRKRLLRVGLRLTLALASPAAALAHDSWLERRDTPPPGLPATTVELALTTGELFPISQTPIAAASLTQRACQSTTGRQVALRPGRASASALSLHARAAEGPRANGAPDALHTCWVQTEAFDVQVADHLVPVYLREIGAPEPVRQAWAEMQQLGQPWIERYTKHARISFEAQAEVEPQTDSLGAPPMALDIEIEAMSALRAGQQLHFRVLRDGVPLAHQAVELRGAMSRLGLWRRTDAEGRASVPLLFAGRWVLRAVDLRPAPGRPGQWESRFVTHAFSARAAASSAPAPEAAPPPTR